ncbi:hypothetical protein AHiyo4_18510 [Arthrobacter sp. Hiyo4]|nr:hypothetical protein AHiyo4_18510 [Arthrobacter sp. Hiyo4]
MAWQATRKSLSWPWKLAILVAAVALASPNLLTAGIMLGNSQAAHNGQRILGTEATWFPMWTQISAIAAVVIFMVGLVLWSVWRQRGQKMRALKKADAERSVAAKAATDPAAGSPVPEAPAAPDSQADRR